MPYFKDDREVYAALGRLFQDLLDDPAAARQFRKADTIVQWQFRNPRAEITTTVPAEGDTSVQLGPGAPKPEVIVAMDADTAHGFWLGRVNVITALSAGQIKARGPVAKILTLVPLVKLAVPHYEALLAAIAAGEITPAPPHAEPEALAADEAPAPETLAEPDPEPEAEAPAEQPAPEPVKEPAPEAPAEEPAPETVAKPDPAPEAEAPAPPAG